MTKANDLASLLDANGDVVSSALDNVPASDLVNDTTPQLGGNLDLNGSDITGTGDINVTGTGTMDRLGLGSAAHASAALLLTTTNQHIRMDNGGELGVIELDSDGKMNIWAHGDGETINLKTGSGSGTDVLSVVGTNVGIGTSSPSVPLEVNASSGQLIYAQADSGDGYVRVDSSNAGSEAVFWARATNTGYSTLQFGDSDDSDVGWIKYQHSDNSMAFRTNGSERLRILSTGDIAFGNSVANTASGYTNQPGGGYVASDSHFEFATTANRAAVEIGKNNANDGQLVAFRKQGTTVGSIGTINSDLYIASSASGHEGLRFGNGAIVPVDTAGASTDAACNLGGATSRFADLYLSGGVYLGGTGAANKMDDFETGNWTPVAASANGDASVTTSVTSANYTKIGNVVYFNCYISMNVTSVGTGAARITGLPFTNNGGYTAFTSVHETFAGSTGQGWIRPNETVLEFLDANSVSQKNISGTGTKYAMLAGSYLTNS